ncbi:MAG: DUF362 domain-containing protein [Candidatus Eisenbacteria bacterium]|nr:DUF362 domain-containing protein [Candidatus Eisenbacteria bacterium]
MSLAGRRTALLKPNIVVGAAPRTGIVTHPAVVEAVVRLLRGAGVSDITIADGPGVGLDAGAVFERSGYRALADRLGVRLVSFNAAERRERPWKYGTLGVPALVEEADLYVNIPKLKTHGYTTLTLSIKNHKGLLSEADKKRDHHLGLHDPLAQHAKLAPPHLVVLDAVVGVEGDGPLNGRPVRAGYVAVGTNMLEVDAAAARLAGFDPAAIAHLRIAAAEGVGTLDPRVIGAAPARRLRPANERYGRKLNIYSWRDCTACSMCIDSFAAGVKLAAREPRYWLTLVPKLAYWGALGRLHIVQGREAALPPVGGRVVCLGQCTRPLSEREGLVHVPGCPPTARQVAEALREGL